jgi:hypothetical protein
MPIASQEKPYESTLPEHCRHDDDTDSYNDCSVSGCVALQLLSFSLSSITACAVAIFKWVPT